jgi:hypothetical protein
MKVLYAGKHESYASFTSLGLQRLPQEIDAEVFHATARLHAPALMTD